MNEKKRRQRGTGGLWQVGNVWWLQYYAHGKKIRKSSGSTNKKYAKNELRRLTSETNLGILPVGRDLSYQNIRDALITDYLKMRRRSLRRDRAGNPLPLDKVKRLDAFFSGYTVEQINSDAQTRFVTSLQKDGKKDSTINRSLSALRWLFRIGMH